MERKKITIVSDGNGAIAAAADLINQGHEVMLYNLKEKEHRMGYLNEKITLIEDDKSFSVQIPYTTDPKVATKDAYMIMYVLPGYAIPVYAKSLAPYTNSETIIFFNAAASLGPLIYAKATNIEPRYAIESNSLTYACRLDRENNTVEMHLRVKELYAASPVNIYTEMLVEKLQEFYPQIKPAKDLIHVFLLNGNPETHCAGCILNAGRIDYSEGEFYLYKEGITKSTLKVMRQVAHERRRIAETLGYEIQGEFESRINSGYFVDFGDDFQNENDKLQYHFNHSPIFRDIKGPTSVGSRYFIEDIAIGLVHWEKLAKLALIETPTITSLIHLGEIIEQKNYRELGGDLVPWSLIDKIRINSQELQEKNN